MLVEHNHSWSSIKQYTLNEIGFFLRGILLLEERNRKEQFSLIWLGQHLNQKGYKEHLESMGSFSKEIRKRGLKTTGKIHPKYDHTQEDIESEWKRFTTAIGGLK